MRDQDNIYTSRLSLGQSAAFDSVFRKYYGKVHNFVYSLVKSYSVAENLTQDVFVNLWVSRHALSSVKSLDKYIFAVSRNMVIDYIRRAKVASEPIPNADEVESRELVDEQYCALEQELMLRLAISKFPERRRVIFTMSRFEGFSNEEIAEKLGLSKKTIENQINLANKDLRKLLVSMSI